LEERETWRLLWSREPPPFRKKSGGKFLQKEGGKFKSSSENCKVLREDNFSKPKNCRQNGEKSIRKVKILKRGKEKG